jgi:hypothetical protein
VALPAERIVKLVVLAAAAVAAAFLLHRVYRHFRGIEVCVRNVDSQPLRSGEVAVRTRRTARQYQLGDLGQGNKACVWVKADNEASVDVTFKTRNGESKVIPLHGYIEPGYSGWISAEVTAEGARDIKHDVDLY